VIVGIDHIGIYARDLDRATADYEHLLGHAPSWRGKVGEHRHAWFQLANVALDVIAPEGSGAVEGIWGIGFAVQDLDAARRTLTRRGIEVQEPAITRSFNERGETREWRIAIARRGGTGGVTQFFVEQSTAHAAPALSGNDAVAGLDHVVITSSNPDRAAALYGARLGLDLRLDRANPEWGSRLQFFRCGDAIIEVGSKIDAAAGDQPDRFGGLAWRVRDAGPVHARLVSSGFDVSELRKGRKPGTRVFTVRSRTVGVPTLILESAAPA